MEEIIRTAHSLVPRPHRYLDAVKIIQNYVMGLQDVAQLLDFALCRYEYLIIVAILAAYPQSIRTTYSTVFRLFNNVEYRDNHYFNLLVFLLHQNVFFEFRDQSSIQAYHENQWQKHRYANSAIRIREGLLELLFDDVEEEEEKRKTRTGIQQQ